MHRRRLQSRQRGLTEIAEPTWDSLDSRRADLAAWTEPRLVLDSLANRAANLALARTVCGGD